MEPGALSLVSFFSCNLNFCLSYQRKIELIKGKKTDLRMEETNLSTHLTFIVLGLRCSVNAMLGGRNRKSVEIQSVISSSFSSNHSGGKGKDRGIKLSKRLLLLLSTFCTWSPTRASVSDILRIPLIHSSEWRNSDIVKHLSSRCGIKTLDFPPRPDILHNSLTFRFELCVFNLKLIKRNLKRSCGVNYQPVTKNPLSQTRRVTGTVLKSVNGPHG